MQRECRLTHAVRRDTRGRLLARRKMLTESVIAIAATAARLALVKHRHTVGLAAQLAAALVKHRHTVALPAQLDPARLVVLACQDESISDGNSGTRQRVSGTPDAALHPASA